MQLRAVSVSGSVLVHLAALMRFVGEPRPAPRPPAPARPAPPLDAVEPAPEIVVELVELTASSAQPTPVATDVPPEPRRADAAGSPSRSRAAAMSRSGSGARGEGAETAAPARAGAGGLTMRRPRVDATLSERFIDDFLARTRPLAPPPPSINAAAHSADARIAELEKLLMSSTRCTLSDGTPCHQLELDSLLRERENLTMRPTGGGRYLNDQEGFQVDVAPDGTVAIRNKPRAKIVGLTVHYDLEAILMEAVGDDAYASSKLHFLDKTRDERAELGRRDRTARLAGAAAQALAHVERLWAATRDPGQRRRALFELWDECAEAGSAELVAAGTAARRIIVGVIRARMRGVDAYSAEELAALNAQRRSAAPFAPYDERLDVGAPDGGGDREGERGGDREGERGGDREGERGGDHRD